jgi:hypothetical protein
MTVLWIHVHTLKDKEKYREALLKKLSDYAQREIKIREKEVEALKSEVLDLLKKEEENLDNKLSSTKEEKNFVQKEFEKLKSEIVSYIYGFLKQDKILPYFQTYLYSLYYPYPASPFLFLVFYVGVLVKKIFVFLQEVFYKLMNLFSKIPFLGRIIPKNFSWSAEGQEKPVLEIIKADIKSFLPNLNKKESQFFEKIGQIKNYDTPQALSEGDKNLEQAIENMPIFRKKWTEHLKKAYTIYIVVDWIVFLGWIGVSYVFSQVTNIDLASVFFLSVFIYLLISGGVFFAHRKNYIIEKIVDDFSYDIAENFLDYTKQFYAKYSSSLEKIENSLNSKKSELSNIKNSL